MSTFNKYRIKGAYHYDWYKTEPWYKECVDEIVKFCKGSTVDVGCGDGLVTKKIAEKGYRAVGLDGDVDAIQLFRQHAHPAQGYLFDVQELELEKDDKFDYLCSLNVIEHLDHPEVLKKIIIRNITKGAIIITNQYLGGALGEDHRREYDYKELVDFFKEFKPKGFKLHNGEYIGVKITL